MLVDRSVCPRTVNYFFVEPEGLTACSGTLLYFYYTRLPQFVKQEFRSCTSPLRPKRGARRRPNGRAAFCGEIQKGAEAPFWSLRRVGGSKGEGDPFERVPFPLGVLLPSFPTREKKVGPAGPKLLPPPSPQARNSVSCKIRINLI